MNRALFFVFLSSTLFPAVSAGMALLAGVILSLVFGNPFGTQSAQWSSWLLQFSIVGLGAAMNLRSVYVAGVHGFVYTAVGIVFTLGLGLILRRLIELESVPAALLSVGTAICGGSAIAAAAAALRAKDHETSVSLATVFLLNAVALFLFPWIGHTAGFNETQFGLWSALAIHDTSSVTGAALQFGPKALELATTVKLARALWIIPTTFALGFFGRAPGDDSKVKTKKPWFIIGFIAMAAFVTWLPRLQPLGVGLTNVAKRALVSTLFLIGCGLSRATLKQIGFRPVLFGLILWLIVGTATFYAIRAGWIS